MNTALLAHRRFKIGLITKAFCKFIRGQNNYQPMRVGKQILFSFSFLCVTSHLPAQVPSLYFDKITNQSGLSNNKVNCILQDTRGFIWLGTDDGLNRYDGNNFTIFRNQPANPHSISGNMMRQKNGICRHSRRRPMMSMLGQILA